MDGYLSVVIPGLFVGLLVIWFSRPANGTSRQRGADNRRNMFDLPNQPQAQRAKREQDAAEFWQHTQLQQAVLANQLSADQTSQPSWCDPAVQASQPAWPDSFGQVSQPTWCDSSNQMNQSTCCDSSAQSSQPCDLSGMNPN